jgi:O-antigen/teichoic acid export membrane protein
MWTRTRNELRVLMHSLSPSDLLNTARRYKKFPIFSTPATLLDSLGPALHVPLITGIFGVSSAGQYSIANQVLVIPAVFIGASVADVFHSRIARLARETPERAPRLFYAVASGLFVVGVAPSAVLYFYGEPLFAAILGEQWRISGVVASALAPRIVSLLVVSPLSRVVMVYQGQELKLVYNALTVLGVILTYHFASKYHWNFVDTMARYTAVQVTLHTVYFVILAFTVHRGTRDLSKMTSA